VDSTDAESIYDSTFGMYCTGVDISASVGTSASYTFNFQKSGVAYGNGLFSWALPHHIESITSGGVRSTMKLKSTTKGVMTGVVADSWTLTETNLATNIGFYPWKPSGAPNTYSASALQTIKNAVISDIAQDMDWQSNLNSMYYSGKVINPLYIRSIYLLDIICVGSKQVCICLLCCKRYC
jgi:endo-1,3(4)-beta-glucanase